MSTHHLHAVTQQLLWLVMIKYAELVLVGHDKNEQNFYTDIQFN